jgi:hypothetical protein
LIQNLDDVSESLSAVLGWNHDPMTVRDRCMLAFMNTITDKVDWTRKVFNEEIVAKWKEEAMAMKWSKANIRYGDMTESMFVCVSFPDFRSVVTNRRVFIVHERTSG